MENQHTNLLDTIKDVEMFKEKMRRIYLLEELIESNRAPAEARLQAKLAYEHFEYGALPFANCREGVQWNGGRRERKRLFCIVNNWKLYNESLNQQREKVKAEVELIINQKFETSPELRLVESKRLKRKENDERREEKRISELKEYIAKLAPFIGIGLEMDEPQLISKYPILKVSDLLTKYLALKDDELTPLPWKLPYCTPYTDNGLLLDEKLKFIENLNSFKKIKSGYFAPSDELSEKKLKNEIFKLFGYNPDNNLNGTIQQPLIREIGQRIGNLLKFNIGPRWLTFNLAALYFRYFGILDEAINCIELALKYSKYQDIALTQLAQIILHTNYSLDNKEDLNGLERILSIAMHSGVNENSKQNFQLSINQIYAPLCCWPNQHEIFCFNQITTKNKKKITNCYRPEPLLENSLFNIKLIYFRCNTPYTGKSYPAPSFARFIIPLLCPAAKLRQLEDDLFAKKLEAELGEKLGDRHKIVNDIPVFPLDYGGYSLNRIRAHQRPIWPEGIKEQINQFQIDFQPPINNEDLFDEQNEFKLTKEIKLEKTTIDEKIFNEYLNINENINKNEIKEIKKKKNIKGNEKEQQKEKSKEKDSIVVDGVTSLNQQSKRFKPSRSQIDGILLGTLSNRGEVLFKLDIPLPEIDDLVDFGGLPELSDLLLEPECSEPNLVLQNYSILLELDELPAYLYREHLTKFYKPEKALKDTFRSIGSSKLDSIERVAAKLFFALKGAAIHSSVSSSKPISSIRAFVLGTLSSLYWRIKGDPVNSIKCLRHSLYNSPNEFIVHFTLANIYSTIGDFPHALQFYYSTLSLQSNFEPAKASITAIHCLTNGILLNKN
uniref:TPR_REGION domain-containing protein n=2 Tax=Meloidogyne hapla TaxID=6305 RepID=A0A1I8BIM2_MELHA